MMKVVSGTLPFKHDITESFIPLSRFHGICTEPSKRGTFPLLMIYFTILLSPLSRNLFLSPLVYECVCELVNERNEL